jgi:DNA/RNA-binding domain of Phe-tRNA-synthetase-like protein
MNRYSAFSRLEDGNPQRIWRMERLRELAAGLPVVQMPLDAFDELDRVVWLGQPHHGGRLTLRQMAEYSRFIDGADANEPLILSAEGEILVGFESLAKAYLDGAASVATKRFVVTPEPDRVRRMPNWLEESLERAKEGYATVHPGVFERFPHYTGVVLYVRNIKNGPSDERSRELLRQAEAKARSDFAEAKLTDHPHIEAWRSAFTAFGVKPAKTLNSAEALISRVLKGKDLPEINWLTDVYNALSVRYVLPIGGEDWDKASGTQLLTIAEGHEDFHTIQSGMPVLEQPQAGEVVWRDDDGITCRAWNWRQCVRTRLTEDTHNAYFVLDSLAPYSERQLLLVSAELQDILQQHSPNCQIKQFILRNPNLKKTNTATDEHWDDTDNAEAVEAEPPAGAES